MGGRKGRRRIGVALLGLLLGGPALFWLLAHPTSTASAPHLTRESGVVQANLTYCTAGGLDLKLDLYLPPALDAHPAPVALYIHGGGWQEGDKNWIDRILPAGRLIARGIAVAAVNYRLAPWATWPAQIADVKCAVRFLRAHAATYQLDPARIGVWGESAGGHLAALLGLAGPAAGWDAGAYPDESSAVQAVVDLCGPADFSNLDLSLGARLQAQLLLGTQPDATLLRRISPVSYVRPAAPPFLIVHGDKDTLVAPAQSQHLAAALRAQGAPVTLVMVTNGEHVFAPAGGPVSPTVPEIDQMIVDFFVAHLQPGGPARTFPQTVKTVRGAFLAAWQARGGVPALGYPVSEALVAPSPLDGTPATLQYFERALLALPAGVLTAPVQTLPLGALAYRQRYPQGAPDPLPRPAPGASTVPGTSYSLDGAFLAYWQTHNGATTLGPPLSAAFAEVSPLDGRARTVQYFTLGELEAHPENAPPYAVLPTALGTLAFRQLPTAPPAPAN